MVEYGVQKKKKKRKTPRTFIGIGESTCFCLGRGKILPGKKSVPELKNGGKNSVPSGVWKGKKEIRREARINFWLIFLVDN